MTHWRSRAIINSSALQNNLQCVRNYSPNSKVLAMVKSNGYGHGVVNVVNALVSSDGFGVAYLREALQLRKAGVTQPIFLMEGFMHQEELADIAAHDLTIVIHGLKQLGELLQTSLPKPVSVWLKVDTGMHRLGFAPTDVLLQACEQLAQCQWVNKPIGLMTHFSDADAVDNPKTPKQIALFEQVSARFDGPKSLANSAGIVAWSETHSDWVRPGIMLYGVSPLLGKSASDFDLKPVMTLQAKLIAKNYFSKGAEIGYGSTWQCPEDMPVGVVSIGYGDGYPRHAKNGTPVFIDGVKCPLVGRVSMDMISVDLRACQDAEIGDVVTLWGDGAPIEELAESSGTIAYELLCGVTQRVELVVV